MLRLLPAVMTLAVLAGSPAAAAPASAQRAHADTTPVGAPPAATAAFPPPLRRPGDGHAAGAAGLGLSGLDVAVLVGGALSLLAVGSGSRPLRPRRS